MLDKNVAVSNPNKKIQKYILDRISSRVWVAHDKIPTEQELMTLLGVSRVAVREAVGGLVARGLLVKRQGAGTFIADPGADSWFDQLYPMIILDAENIRLLLEFRCNFECGNMKLFMQYRAPEDVEELERNYEQMVAARYADPDKSAALDFEFHRIIALGTKNPYVIRINHILTDIMKSHQKAVHQAGDPDNAFEYHKEIIKYVKRNDAFLAVSFMQRHVESAMASLKKNGERQ